MFQKSVIALQIFIPSQFLFSKPENKYTLETHFKEFWTNLEGENLSEDELAYMDKTNNYKLSCSKKSPLL